MANTCSFVYLDRPESLSACEEISFCFLRQLLATDFTDIAAIKSIAGP